MLEKKPVIGIVGRADFEKENYNVICCFESVRRSIIKKGGIPVLILPNQDIDYESLSPRDVPELTGNEKDELTKVIDLCDGILIPGTFKLYEYDKFIYMYALEKDIPILGICGGMQLMAIINKSREEIKNTIVKNETEINHFMKGQDYVHKLKILDGTLLKSIIGKSEIMVNSRHNLHISTDCGLKVSAYSIDGLIEAVEVPNKKFVLGVQWHPESMLDYDDDANKIFDKFINTCKKQ